VLVHKTDTSSTFNMTGGEISKNDVRGSDSGGGVRITANNTFIMGSGRISRNFAKGPDSKYSGGGVNIIGADVTFTMIAGEISGNFVEGDISGGGVRIAGLRSTFTMHSGRIFGNDTLGGDDRNGGGVYVGGGSTLAMHDGDISGNTAVNGTGGVKLVEENASLQIENGTIQALSFHSPPNATPSAHCGTFDGNGVFERCGDILQTTDRVTVLNGKKQMQ
jgi:hypothetical protein